ncbi:MAG: O-antigen ligase family protein, partial [Phycisphaerales bacterium]
MGIIEIGTDFRLADALHQKLPSTMFNANNTSHICVFSILFLIIKQRSEKKFSRYYVLRDLLIILFLVSMAVINATRGAVINLFILIPYYFFMVWKESKDTVAKSALIAVMFLTAAIVAFNASKITLATRIKIYHSIMPDRPVRIDNLMNTWDNFRTHPFVGVGFENAAKTDLRHGSRSNNQFMQLLAS